MMRKVLTQADRLDAKTVDGTSEDPIVMIIDDDATTRMMATEFLSQAGFQIREAADGINALATINEIDPDLILLDVEMPGMDGYEVCTKLRNTQRFAMIPILMLTGLNNNEAIDLAYEAGATDFATKPINWSLLCHRLRYMQRASQADRKIHQLAYYDTLTGLANRTLFQDELESAIDRASLNQNLLAVLYFDLDDFKRINDTFGHTMGDKLLLEVGERLLANTTTIDTTDSTAIPSRVFARMGGDEFTLLLDNLDQHSEATELAEHVIQVLSQPFTLSEYELFITPSVGVAYYPEDGENAEALLKSADMAMYEAKRSGKNAFRTHNEHSDAKAKKRHLIDAQLRIALEQNEISVHYQPQLELDTGKLYAAEALVRWTNADLGVVSPAEFIPVAEENGLIVPLGELVLRTACEQVQRWVERDVEIGKVAVNISALQFMRTDFPTVVATVLAESKLAPDRLELEITESVLATDITHAVNTLRKLKDIGVVLSIDDFGTGYSSLSQLKHFPIDRLKIDQSFIRHVTQSCEDAAITRAVIAMADSMNIRVLAEGVETLEQLEFLRANACDEIQGYYLSRPLMAAQLDQQMQELRNRLDSLFPQRVISTLKRAG